MRIAGLLLLIAGCVFVVAGMSMDTTVEVPGGDYVEFYTGTGPRVHNLQLAARQDHMILIGCFVALAGVNWIGFAEVRSPSEPFDPVAYEDKMARMTALFGKTAKHYPPPKTDPSEAPPPLSPDYS